MKPEPYSVQAAIAALLPAARADLLRSLGRREQAAKAYRRALALVANEPERRFLERRLAEVEGAAE
jgi:RNA polymerase sigma-70 factor, ECF subfamily